MAVILGKPALKSGFGIEFFGQGSCPRKPSSVFAKRWAASAQPSAPPAMPTFNTIELETECVHI